MTPPRKIHPGATYLVTRRCAFRRFGLVPRKHTHEVFGYALAVASARYGIEVQVAMVLSNHYHAVLTDPRGKICEFLQYLHSLLARCLNAHAGTWENFWSTEGCSLVRLVDAADIVDKAVYCLTNPVAAGLVAKHQQWPGFFTPLAWLDGPGKTFRRPEGFFRDKGPMPLAATLRLTRPSSATMPPGPETPGPETPRSETPRPETPTTGRHEPDEAEDFAAQVADKVRATEERLTEERKAAGTRVLGIEAIKRQRRSSRPKTCEPRRGLDPTIAARNPASRLRELAVLTTFRQAYREALGAWRGGDRTVRFPAGTLQMVRHFGAFAHAHPHAHAPPLASPG